MKKMELPYLNFLKAAHTDKERETALKAIKK
jgi:hypothetical protein